MYTTKSKSFKLILMLLAIFAFAQVPLKAATLVNALLTERYFRVSPKKYSDKEKTAFRVGLLFPKIHYLAPEVKDVTRFPEATLQDVINENSPFVAGMKFLSFVERLREDFVIQNDYYQLVADVGVDHIDTYLKFVEDELVYPSLKKKDWKEAIKKVHPDEKLWGVSDDVLKEWHKLLGYSFTYKPSTIVTLAYLKGNGLLDVPQTELSIWLNTFDGTAKLPEIKLYVDELFKMYSAEVK